VTALHQRHDAPAALSYIVTAGRIFNTCFTKVPLFESTWRGYRKARTRKQAPEGVIIKTRAVNNFGESNVEQNRDYVSASILPSLSSGSSQTLTTALAFGHDILDYLQVDRSTMSRKRV